MKTGLVLVDIQNDYFKGGKYELFEPEKAVLNAKKILDFFRNNKMPIFYVKHINTNEKSTFFIQGTDGTNIYKDVCPEEGEKIIIKHTPDSFFQTNLQNELKSEKITELVVCGMMTHMCIDTTVRAARNFGYNVTLIEDACACRDLIWNEEKISALIVQKTFMASLNGTFADIKIADKWIEENSK